MKILLLTQYYPPEGGSCSAHMGELAEDLVERGHEVTVVTGFPNYPDGKIYQGFRRALFKRERLNGIGLIRTFLFVTPKRRSFGPRLFNYTSFMITSFLGALIAGKKDLIYFYSPPLFLGVTAALLGRIWKVPVVMELNDLWPRGPIALGVVRNRFAIKLAETLEMFVYKNSTKIFTYSKRMREEVIKAGVPEEKVEIHNLWIDSKFFKPASSEEADVIRKQYGLEGKFVVMYTGLVGMAQGLEVLVDAAEILASGGENDIVVVIVGGGPEREGLVQRTKTKGLENVVLVDQQPREKMPAFTSAADVLVSHLTAAPHRIGTIPAKILAYMAGEKPVLVGAEGEAADLVKNLNCGLAVPPDDPEAMAEGIKKLHEMPAPRLQEMIVNGKIAIDKYYERKKVVSSLEEGLDVVRYIRDK